jgi:hypothetical protein
MLKHIEKITNVTCRVASGLADGSRSGHPYSGCWAGFGDRRVKRSGFSKPLQ